MAVKHNISFFSCWRERVLFIWTVLKILVTSETCQYWDNTIFTCTSFKSTFVTSTTVLSSDPCQSAIECALKCVNRHPQCVGFDFHSQCVIYSGMVEAVVPSPGTDDIVYKLIRDMVTTTTAVPTTTTVPPTTTALTTTPATTTTPLITTTGPLVPVRECHDYGNVFDKVTLQGVLRCIRAVNEQPSLGSDANDACGPYGTSVALETKQKIDEWRNFLISEGKYESSGYWVGLNDIGQEGTYVWDKHGQVAPSTGDIWEGGAPTSSSSKNCIALIGNDYLTAENCMNMFRLACEIDIYVPE